jgi:hypothetical protein
MVVREILVVKKPRDDQITDKPVAFPPLENLYLDLMENKNKLKKGVPTTFVDKPRVNKPVLAEAIDPSITLPTLVDGEPSFKENFDGKVPKSTKSKEPEPEESEVSDEEMMNELGGGEPEEEPVQEEITSSSRDGSFTTSQLASTTDQEPVATETSPPDPYEGLSPEEKEAKEKEEYIWRFRILKKANKNRDIPEYTIHDDLLTMKTEYDRSVKDIHIDKNLSSYKTYLSLGFIGIEWFCVNMLGTSEMDGFSTAQRKAIDDYDYLLIELGERSYNRWGSNLPVEIKLIGVVMLNAMMFYASKVMMRTAGADTSMLFQSFSGVKADTAEEPKQRKMRGPSIKAGDVRKMAASTKEENEGSEDTDET